MHLVFDRPREALELQDSRGGAGIAVLPRAVVPDRTGSAEPRVHRRCRVGHRLERRESVGVFHVHCPVEGIGVHLEHRVGQFRRGRERWA